MKKYVLVVAVAAALFSCSGNPKADATQTDKNKQETAQVPDMHNAETSLDYWGCLRRDITGRQLAGY